MSTEWELEERYRRQPSYTWERGDYAEYVDASDPAKGVLVRGEDGTCQAWLPTAVWDQFKENDFRRHVYSTEDFT